MADPAPWRVDLPDEAATERLGEALALLLRAGDVVTLAGPLGAGKTTLARAILRSFSALPGLEVPSPTFTLVQTYEGAGFRFPVVHADLYRIASPDDLDELGLDEAAAEGALLVEWPERAGERLPSERIEVTLQAANGVRAATVSSPAPGPARRIARAAALRAFLHGTPYAGARRIFLQGDASPRAYERLTLADGARAVLLDASARPDRPTPEARRRYMARTHLAPNEDVRPILAVGAELARRGVSVPRVLAASVEGAALVLEDFGAHYVAVEGRAVPERYAAAVDLLAHMHGQDWPHIARGPFGAEHRLPRYGREALEVEAALVVDHVLPMLGRASPETRASYLGAFAPAFDLVEAAPRTWTLFDFHSPNLHWLPEREGVARIGVIDFQDARLGPEAYDVVSLAQDARVDVEPALEVDLVARYAAARRRDDPAFDTDGFAALYAICGAQRASRILGVFTRLAAEDGKPGYLRHLARISGYLDRNLAHPVLAPVARWYETHAPARERDRLARRLAEGA